MLVLLRFMFFFIMISSLSYYLFVNIKILGAGSPALDILAFCISIGVFLIWLELLLKQSFFIKKSFFFLVLFFTYYIVNIVINKPDELKVLTFSTTGGIILFYILGALLSINLLYLKEKVLSSRQFLGFFNFFYYLFSVIFIGLFLGTFLELMSNIRTDLFLISDLDGMYQRPGAFLVISFFIYSFITAFFLFINKNSKALVLLFFCLYLMSIIGGMLLSQMIGSNNTLVNLAGLLFANIIFYILINFTKIEKEIGYINLNLKKIFLSNLSNKLLGSILVSLFLVLILLTFIVNMLDIELEKFRIFGFDTGEISSVSSRLELWSNFIIHFDYNPVFGNMAVDTLTTGKGSYVHSFIGTLLTHLGLVGFSLFFIYIFIAIKEKLKIKRNFYINNVFSLYSLVVFVGIFSIASFGTFITWLPIWFLLGLIFPPIMFDKRN